MSVSSILISLSETYQQMYLHVSSVTLSKKVNEMQLSMKSGVSTDFYQCWPYITFFNDFHDPFRVEINTEITKKDGCITCTSQCNRSYKDVCVNRIPENVALRMPLTKMTITLFCGT